MTTPPQSGIDLIKEFECCHTEVRRVYQSYPDPGTNGEPWTIGWGSTKNEYGGPFYPGDQRTQQQCDALLDRDCRDGMDTLASTIPYWDEMHDDQHGALLSFGYNVGYGFYGADGFDTITRELKERNWAAVPGALMLYVKAGGQTMPGLARRREAEGQLWVNGMHAQPPSPPEPPMGTTFEDFINTYKYWADKPHQIDAAGIAYQALAGTDQLETYFNIYRTPAEPLGPPPYVIIAAPYFNQRDNPSGLGDRECFATSCAVSAVYHYGQTNGSKGCATENEYHKVFPKYGDSTDANTHLRCLQESFNLHAQFVTNASADNLKAELNKGRPTPCGWLHHGHVSSPSGSGHYCCAVGYDDDNGQWIFHDPYGEANLVGGGYVVLNSIVPNGVVHGNFIRYSYKNWTPRWAVENPTTGWMLRIWA
jgi:GH24 family phage-related lysozyme (muramidase)